VHKFAVLGVTKKSLSKPFMMAGLVSWVAILIIAITSVPKIRNAWYGLFKVSCAVDKPRSLTSEVCHVAGMIMLLVGMCFHVDVAVPWW
jgi:hypothetical protein